jgi:hypothetical protein
MYDPSIFRVYSEEQPGEAATALFIKQVSSQDAGLYRYSRSPVRMLDCTGTAGIQSGCWTVQVQQVSSQDAGLYRYSRSPVKMLDCTGTAGLQS